MSESNIADDLRIKFETAIKETIANSEQYQAEKFKRNRVLDMKTMVKAIHLFRGGSLSKELHELSIPVTPSAFVQRRKKLSSMLFEEILSAFNGKCNDPELYHGLRVMAVDGTAVNLARDPKASTFIQNASNPKGYNQMHACCIYDVLNKTYHSCSINRDEIGALLYALDWYDFDKNTLFVTDRGYSAYSLFATFIEKGYYFLIRTKQAKSAMKKIAELPMEEFDRDISFTITTTQTKEDKEKGYILVQTQKNKNRTYSPNTRAGRFDYPTPYHFSNLRVVRFMLNTGEYETLVTNLPRGQNGFSSKDLAELYHARWGIETSFSELKYGIGLNLLHGKSEEFARQELYAALTISNFCSRVAREVVIQKKSETTYAYKVNQKMAIYLCRKFLIENTMTGEQLMKEIARYTEPVRPGRSDERNIKPKSFPGFTFRIAA